MNLNKKKEKEKYFAPKYRGKVVKMEFELKKVLVITTILLGVLFSQDTTEVVEKLPEIKVEKSFWGNTPFIGDTQVPLTYPEFVQLIKNVPEAHALLKKSKKYENIGMGFVLGGGLLTGYPLGRSLAGGDPDWTPVYIGVVSLGTGFYFSGKAGKYLKQSIEVYNQNR